MGVVVYGKASLVDGEYEGRPWFRLELVEQTFDANGEESDPIEVRISLSKDQYKSLKLFDGDNLVVRAKVDPKTGKLKYSRVAPANLAELLAAA